MGATVPPTGSITPDDEPAALPLKRGTSGTSPLAHVERSWRAEKDADEMPRVQAFCPNREVGPHVTGTTFTPVELFKLFFSEGTMRTLCVNTNKQAALKMAKGCGLKWTDVCPRELYAYIGLTIYMTMLKLDRIKDYWLQADDIFSVPFPATVMSWNRYRFISWNLKMSHPSQDQKNDRKRGTPEYDSLCQTQPLLDTIRTACKAYYHPGRNVVVHDQMTATKGYKLFLLTDAANGYHVDFAVYRHNTSLSSGRGLSYDAVMSLLNRSYLGTGYNVFMDCFYTSPKLFLDLLKQYMGACGPYRDSREGCPPPSTSNALDKDSSRGAIRWIRDGPLLFVKWVDTREVALCSTIHKAFSGEKVQGWVRPKTGGSTPKTYQCPSAVVDYNKHTAGISVPDQLLQYYVAQQSPMKWVRKLFLQCLDIAVTNAFILHEELSGNGDLSGNNRKSFLEELVGQLCGLSDQVVHNRAISDHVPVPVEKLKPRSLHGHVQGWCLMCNIKQEKVRSPWKCKTCNVTLCLELDRNCFKKWHS